MGASGPCGTDLLCVVGCQVVAIPVWAGMASSQGEVPTAVRPSDFLAHPLPALVGSVLGAVAALVAYRTFMRRLRHGEVLELSTGGALRELAVGLAVGAGVMVVCFVLLAAMGVYRVHGLGWQPAAVGALAVGIMAGVGEELFARATLLRLLSAWVGPWWALAATSVFFGAAHLLNDGATLIGVVAIVLEAGVLLTGRVWMAIGVHIAWNAVQAGLFGSTISGNVGGGQGLIQTTWHEADLLTGGSMGVEGSLVTIAVGLAAGAALLAAARRRGRLT